MRYLHFFFCALLFGQKFDLRAFHDEVLKNGALPMSVLGTHLKEWVAKAKSA